MHHTRRSVRGSNAVEFALTLPLLLTIMGAIIDYSWFFTHYSAVMTAAREGARVAAGWEDGGTAVSSGVLAASESLTDAGYNAGEANIVGSVVGFGSGDQGVTISVSLPYDPLVNFGPAAPPTEAAYDVTMRYQF